MKAAAVASPRTIRVAIYCRQSVEDTTNTFDSLTAQRQAVEAYVASQRETGWRALPEIYNDGGFSGSNTSRPAFRRLLADVRAGRIDVVATYKLDRLSRSITDFVDLMRTFEEHSVTFVSVTQQFSTTSSVGRMTMNLLATFAQFERETIAERTRDKMRAARRKGMWTGGPPVLGYDLKDKHLIVNETEAAQVREIFGLYLDLGSVNGTIEELNRRGLKTKTYKTREGRQVIGGSFSRSSLPRLLKCPLYLGLMHLGHETHPGLHEAIVPQQLFDAVQAKLAINRERGGSAAKNKYGTLLRGLVHCARCGQTMTHAVTSKAGRRHQYYVCSRALKQGASSCPGSRVALGALESSVIDRIRDLGRAPQMIEATIQAALRSHQERRPALLVEAQRWEAETRRLDRSRASLVDAVAQGGPGVRSVMERIESIEQEIAASTQRAKDAQREAAVLDAEIFDQQAIRKALENFDPVWGALWPREKARILSLLIERVSLDGTTGEVVITLRRKQR